MSSMDDSPRLPDDSQGGREMAEQRKVADRLWAYSDAVFAVIVTVMVLQLRTPTSHHFSSLLGLWPTLISYVASYVFIAIIWINYHYLSRFVETPSLGLVWINFLHLLFVSLIPFTTAWMARTRLASDPVIVYTALFVCAASVFNVLEYQVFKQTSGAHSSHSCFSRWRSSPPRCSSHGLGSFWFARRSSSTSSQTSAPAALLPRTAHQVLERVRAAEPLSRL
jgi:uncharacterized membrane protein